MNPITTTPSFLPAVTAMQILFTLKITDYKGWAHGLKKAGYATNPRYPQLLIKIIEENLLYEFDKGITPNYLTQCEIQSSLRMIPSLLLQRISCSFRLMSSLRSGKQAEKFISIMV